MHHNKTNRKKKSAQSAGKTICKSLIIGLILFIIFLAISSVIVLSVGIQKTYLYLFVLAGTGFSSFFGSLAASRHTLNKHFMYGTVVSVSLLIIEFILLLSFNNTSMSNKIYLIIPIMLFMGFIGSIIGTNNKKK